MDAIVTALLILAGLSLVGLCLKLTLRPPSSRGTSGRAVPSPILTHHAKQRMVERKISSRQIELVIAEPTRAIRDTKNHSVRLERTIAGRTLKVWVAEPWPAPETFVKTAAWVDVPVVFEIPAGTAGRVIGRGGATINRIQSDYDVRVSVDHAGFVRITSGDSDSAYEAKREILSIVNGNAPAESHLAAA